MLAAYLAALPIALGLILATAPVLPVPLLLAARPGAGGLVGFLAGWALGFCLVGLVVIGIADLTAPAPDLGAPWLIPAQGALGLVLVWLGLRKLNGRALAGAAAPAPVWMAKISALAPVQALVAGVLLVVANPKNVVLVASGALVIAEKTGWWPAQAAAMAMFTGTASLGLAAPLLLRLTLGAAAARPLNWLKDVIARVVPVLLALVLVVLGGLLAADALRRALAG